MERRLKVLLVDDEPPILKSTELLLHEMGYDVVSLDNAQDVLGTLRRERPDLLLQDVRMPGLDVDRLVRAIRADPAIASTPVVLFSAGMDLEEISERVGARTLEKPFRPDELDGALRGAIS